MKTKHEELVEYYRSVNGWFWDFRQYLCDTIDISFEVGRLYKKDSSTIPLVNMQGCLELLDLENEK